MIQDRKLLVERSIGKEFFIAPGGSIEEKETGEQALTRELREEFDIDTKTEDFEYFGQFSAPAAGQEHRTVNMKVWLVKRWAGEPKPNSEVEEIAWIVSGNPENISIGSIFLKDVIPRLVDMGLID